MIDLIKQFLFIISYCYFQVDLVWVFLMDALLLKSCLMAAVALEQPWKLMVLGNVMAFLSPL